MTGVAGCTAPLGNESLLAVGFPNLNFYAKSLTSDLHSNASPGSEMARIMAQVSVSSSTIRDDG